MDLNYQGLKLKIWWRKVREKHILPCQRKLWYHMICTGFGEEVLDDLARSSRRRIKDTREITSCKQPKTKIRDYDRATRMPTVACNPNNRLSTICKLAPTATLESWHELGAIRKGVTNSNPHSHAQVVEHKLGANPRGITRIRVARSLQTQDKPMSLFWIWKWLKVPNKRKH